ncbi:MAG: hypothetical protein NTV51_13325 [Verrucomicrobia bacterium]|nr:hypothetical protein [Verrucomicrobiota bacterium]
MGPPNQPMRQVSPEVPRARPVAAAAPQEEGFSLSLDDVYHTIFRHKLKIILCAIAGFGAAGAWYASQKPTYISEARLYVRFVAVEGMSTRSSPDDPVYKSPDMRGETIMISEQEIVSSFDLIKQVAQVIGPEKILAPFGGGSDVSSAAIVLRKGLVVQTSASIIGISFQHPDHELIQPVLREVIQQYFKKHMEIHHSSGMSGDILTQETDTLKAKLSTTEDELRKAKNKAGVVSVEDAKKVNSQQVATIRAEIFAAEAELAERTAILQENTKLLKKETAEAGAPPKSAATETAPVAAETVAPEPAVSPELFEEYRSVAIRAETLRQQEVELLRTYTPESPRAKNLHAQLLEAQAKKQEIETANPRLMAALSRTAPVAASQSSQAGSGGRAPYDPAAEVVHINSLKVKIKVLYSQIETLRAESAALSQLEGNIQDLMRKRDLEEANYRRYAASQEAARINDALGSGKVSNISVIQTPSTPAVADKNRMKIPGALAGGGIALGLAWAFLFELFLDPTVRRPVDVEKKLRMPLFLSIPNLALPRPSRLRRWRNRKQLAAPAEKSTDGTMVAVDPSGGSAPGAGPEVSEESLQPFHETLRDRLISYCESQNLTRKPKLIAVTGLGRKSGVTTTAAGLARTLSETGEGNVLLVDLTSSQGSAMQFLKGTPTRGLDELLDSKDNVQVQQNLYVVTDSNNSEQLSRNLPRRFTKLIPKIKASDFDYVVFDMPPVSQLSITPRLAGFMDIVLFVVESEKTNLDMVKRATALLGASKAHVGAILNKTHNYVPQRLHQDNLSHF